MKPDSEFWDIQQNVLHLQGLERILDDICKETDDFGVANIIYDAKNKIEKLERALIELQRELI